MKGDFKIRVGMGNPNSFLKDIKEYLDTFEQDRENKIYRFFHIPVQSGSDKILKDMNRFYNIKDFKNLINIIRSRSMDEDILSVVSSRVPIRGNYRSIFSLPCLHVPDVAAI